MARPADENDKNVNKKLDLNPNKMMVINSIVMLIVIIVSMITMYVLLDNSFSKKIAKLMPDEQEQMEEGDAASNQGILLDLGEFILNLADTTGRRYLKVGVALEISKTQEEIDLANIPQKQGHSESQQDALSASITAEMERYKPAIRDAVISVLSSKTSDELSTPTGKELAKEEILEMVNGIFEGQREVVRVSFGQFIIQ